MSGRGPGSGSGRGGGCPTRSDLYIPLWVWRRTWTSRMQTPTDVPDADFHTWSTETMAVRVSPWRTGQSSDGMSCDSKTLTSLARAAVAVSLWPS